MTRVFIIQNTPLNEPLPLSVFLTNLLKNFYKSQEFELNLIVGKSGNIPVEIEASCNKIYQLPVNTYSIKDNMVFGFKVKKILKRENRSKRIDVVHCFYPNSSLLGAVLFKSFFHRQVRIVYDVRSPWIEMSIARGFVNRRMAPLYKYFLYLMEWFLCSRVQDFVFVTSGLADYYGKKLRIKPNKGIFIIPSGVDLTIFKPVTSGIRGMYGITDDEIMICSVGGIAKVRSQDEFLDIFKDVTQEIKKIKLMFVGEGDLLEDLKKKVRELNLIDQVIFTGSVPHHRVPEYMSASDFGLSHLPDMFIHRNNFSLKILEYLACGVPVLASKINSNVEISKRLTGVYIYENSRDILDILKKQCSRPLNQDMSDYAWENLASSYKKIYKKV